MVKGGPRYKIIKRVLEPLRDKLFFAKQNSPLSDSEVCLLMELLRGKQTAPWLPQILTGSEPIKIWYNLSRLNLYIRTR